MFTSYLKLIFEVVRKTGKSRYAIGDDIRLVNLGPTAFFSNFKLKTSSEKHLKVTSHTLHLVSLACKLITTAKDTDNLSTGFRPNRNRRRHELTRNKNIKDENQVIINSTISSTSQNVEKKLPVAYAIN